MLVEEAIGLFQAIGDRYSMGALWGSCGLFLLSAGQRAEARQYLEKAAALFHEIGMPEQAAPAEEALERLGDED